MLKKRELLVIDSFDIIISYPFLTKWLKTSKSKEILKWVIKAFALFKYFHIEESFVQFPACTSIPSSLVFNDLGENDQIVSMRALSAIGHRSGQC